MTCKSWINAKLDTLSWALGFSVIYIYLMILWCQVVSCDPTEEPIKCSNGNTNCTITNVFGSFLDRSTCHAADVAYPENEDELIFYVREASKNKRKIKVATRYGHSFPKLVCPDGVDGLVISTKNLNKVLNVNTQEATLTVESGMTLLQLKDEAAKVNLALPQSPYWAGVTVGGMIGTGAHGSSLWGIGSAAHEYVVGLRIVSPGGPEDDFVKVRTLGVGDEDLNAAKVSLGVLGVISQVTFKLDPQFKRNITYITRDDTNLGDEALTFGHQHEFADIVWLPSQRKAVYRIDDRVPSSTPGDGLYDFIPFRPLPAFVLESIRAAEDVEHKFGLDKLLCTTAKAVTSSLIGTAFGLTNNGIIFTGYPVIGYQHKMQASAGCLDSRIGFCGWDPRIKGLFYYSNGISLPMNNVKSFIQDVQTLVNQEPTSLCGLEFYYGVLMRYVKASSAYLGKNEDGVEFDIVFYRPREPSGPLLYEDLLDEIEQMAVVKYGGLPHWGKNRNVAFEGVIKKYKDGSKFLKFKGMYDPSGLFSNEWTDQILGLKDGTSVKQEGCARAGLCVCSEDNDCGQGYSCVSGRVYTEAKVCRKV